MRKNRVLRLALLLIVIIACSLGNWQCNDKFEKKSAWSQLSKRNLEYKPEQFIKFVKADEEEVVGLYLELGMDPNLKLVDGNYPIIIASGHGSKRALRKLIQAGANVNAVYKNEVTPLLAGMLGKIAMNDVSQGQGEINHRADSTLLKILLDSGADVNLNGYTLMMLSIRHALKYNGDLSILRILINAGLDVNRTPQWGKPCLLLALEALEYGLVEEALVILLRAGADPQARFQGRAGINAVDMAKSQSFINNVGRDKAQRVLRILDSAGAVK
jgi:ankyrin repeat protein